jgi:succinoglycan biosynthesis transport protein ExoP
MIAFDEPQNFVNGNASPSPAGGFQHPTPNGGIGVGALSSFLSIMRRRLVAATLTFLLVFAIFALYIFTRQPLYSSLTVIDLNPNGSSGSGISDVLQQNLGYDEANSQVATQIEVLRGDALSLDGCNHLGLLSVPAFTSTLEDPVSGTCNNLSPHDRTTVLQAMRRMIQVDSVAGTNLVRIDVTTPDRELSKKIASGLVDSFINSNLRAGVAGTSQVSDWLSNQMQALQEQVSATQKELAAFQRDKNIVGTDSTGQGENEELGLIQTQLASAAADRIQKEALLKVAQSSTPELLSSISDGTNIQVLRNQKVQLQAAYDQLVTKFGPGYPRVQELSQQIAESQAALDREVSNVRKKLQNDYTAAAQVEDSLNARYKQKQQEAFQLNDSAAHYGILRQNAESARDLYNAIAYKLRESGIEETLKSAEIRVIEPAALADKPVYPRKLRMLFFGLLVAIFLACVVAYVLNYLDDSFHVPEVIEQLTGLPVLVTVPHIDGLSAQALESATSSISPRLVSVLQPMALATEAYRALRSSVLLSRAGGNISVQLITSGSESEGKSLTACNYAVTLAQQGLRVLLVDADLRRGSVHTYFGIPRSPGVSQLLSTTQQTRDFVNRIPAVPGLDVLTIGLIPPNPSELLNSVRFTDLIAEWRDQYDFVIIDSAPVLPVADSYGLVTKADLVILVVRIEQTRSRSLVRTEEILRRLKAPVIGVVVNDVTSRSQGYRYHYYGEYSYAENKAKGRK